MFQETFLIHFLIRQRKPNRSPPIASAPQMQARGNRFDYIRLRAEFNGRPMRSRQAPRGNCPVR